MPWFDRSPPERVLPYHFQPVLERVAHRLGPANIRIYDLGPPVLAVVLVSGDIAVNVFLRHVSIQVILECLYGAE